MHMCVCLWVCQKQAAGQRLRAFSLLSLLLHERFRESESWIRYMVHKTDLNWIELNWTESNRIGSFLCGAQGPFELQLLGRRRRRRRRRRKKAKQIGAHERLQRVCMLWLSSFHKLAHQAYVNSSRGGDIICARVRAERRWFPPPCQCPKTWSHLYALKHMKYKLAPLEWRDIKTRCWHIPLSECRWVYVRDMTRTWFGSAA